MKVWEVSRDRPKLTATYSLTSSAAIGNDIIIENTSKVPALISYWELMWADRRFGGTVFGRMEQCPDEGYCNITVPAHSTSVLHFQDEDHFDTRSEVDGDPVSLYLRVYLASRKSSIWLFVWKADR